MEDRLSELVWVQLKAELRPDKWTVGESANYKGFFMHGWDAAIRVTDPLIEKMAEALEELDDMFDPTSRVGEIINKALQEYREGKDAK